MQSATRAASTDIQLHFVSTWTHQTSNVKFQIRLAYFNIPLSRIHSREYKIKPRGRFHSLWKARRKLSKERIASKIRRDHRENENLSRDRVLHGANCSPRMLANKKRCRTRTVERAGEEAGVGRGTRSVDPLVTRIAHFGLAYMTLFAGYRRLNEVTPWLGVGKGFGRPARGYKTK